MGHMSKLLRPAIASILTTSACLPDDALLLSGEEREAVAELLREEEIFRPITEELYAASFFTFKQGGDIVDDAEQKKEFVEETGELLHSYFNEDRIYVRDDLQYPFDNPNREVGAWNNRMTNVIVLSRDSRDFWDVDLLMHESAHEVASDSHNNGSPNAWEYGEDVSERLRYEADMIEYARETHDPAEGVELITKYVTAIVGSYGLSSERELLAGDEEAKERLLEAIEVFTNETEQGHVIEAVEKFGVAPEAVAHIFDSGMLLEARKQYVEEIWERGERERREAEEARVEFRPGPRR